MISDGEDVDSGAATIGSNSSAAVTAAQLLPAAFSATASTTAGAAAAMSETTGPSSASTDPSSAPLPPPSTDHARTTICVSSPTEVLHPSHPSHSSTLASTMTSPESRILERTIALKTRLRPLATYDFWQVLMEGMAEIMGSQYAFVSKRVLVDDENSAVEMPAIGEPGSCLMGLAFYFNDKKGKEGLFRDYKYQVYGCPCQWMKNDKVVLISENLVALTPEHPNAAAFPIPAEGYLAVPLFHEEKCYGHFGALWTEEGLRDRNVSWGMLEMFLHSLEEMVGERVLEGMGLGPRGTEKEKGKTPVVIPNTAVAGGLKVPPTNTAPMEKPSLRPYARRLSHELRTPMQGVVGMLDVMYASVIEASAPSRGEWPDLNRLRDVIEGLRSSIEVAQDSSKRAVDAADNMVYGYDFNMEVPATPSLGDEDSLMTTPGLDSDYTYSSLPSVPEASLSDEDENPSIRRPSKRRRASSNPAIHSPLPKTSHLEAGLSSPPVLSPSLPRTQDNSYFSIAPGSVGTSSSGSLTPGTGLNTSYDNKFTLTSSVVRLRQLLHEAVHHSIRSGGRPDHTTTTPTPYGEIITVETANATPDLPCTRIEITVHVDPTVPETIVIDSQDLLRLITSVFHNAFKFTPSGRITLTATPCTDPVSTIPLTMPAKTPNELPTCILLSCTDTGSGIPEDFVPNLFHPFSRSDTSLTRPRDGLGLGLMVAKSIARKMGGDLWCERTSTTPPNTGSEFRIRLPISPLPEPTLPANIPTSPAPPIAPTLPPPASKPLTKLPYDPDQGRKHPLRILVVEDNRINRSLLVSMLRKLGYENVLEARDGVEAVEVFEEQWRGGIEGDRGKGVDLVLMDLWMPRMDGFSAARKIRGVVDSAVAENEKTATEAAAAVVQGEEGDGASGGGSGVETAARVTAAQGDVMEGVETSTSAIVPSAGTAGGLASRMKDVTVLAVSADATEMAREKAREVGIGGFVEKPFGIRELGEAVGRV